MPGWYYGSVYQRIARCETHENWQHNAGAYEGAFGFYVGTWRGWKPAGYPSHAYSATPRQQLIVAVRVARSVGFGAWGCWRNATWVRG